MLCLCPVQNPQADHCRLQEVGTYCQESRRLDQWVPELVLQERWRVLNPRTWTKTGAFWVQILMNCCCSCRDGLDRTGPGYPDWRPAGARDSPSVTGETAKVGTGLHNLRCTKDTNRQSDSHSDHTVFTLSLKLDPSFYFVLLFGYLQCLWGSTIKKTSSSIGRNLSHTPAHTWKTCVFSTDQTGML